MNQHFASARSEPPLEIDVCVVERNSSRTLAKCLSAIKRNLPGMGLIVLDDHSSDGSVSIARQFTNKVFSVSGVLGAVRYEAAKLSKGRWIIFIDSDVYVYPTWWSWVKAFLKDNKIGWVTGLCDFPCILPIVGEYHDYKFLRHGATAFSNTVLRRDMMLKCKEVQVVHGGEDWTVKNFIMDHGLKTITVTDKLSYHDNEIVRGYFRAYFRWGQSYRLNMTPRNALAIGFFSFIKYPLVDWLTFTRIKKFSLPLLFFLILVGISGMLGVLRKMQTRQANTRPETIR